MTCPYCGGGSWKPLWENVRDRLGYVPGQWGFRSCLTCGSACLFPAPDPSQLASLYPPVYDLTPDLLETKDRFARLLFRWEERLFFQPQYEAQARRILRLLGRKKASAPGSLLDIGCGGGLRLATLRRYGFQVHGTDFRPDVVQALKEHLKIPAVLSNATEIERHFPSGSFDIVTAFHFLEHIPDIRSTLRACLTLLAPGGILIATVPLVNSLQAALFQSRWAGATEAPRHLSIPSPHGMQKVLEETGFEYLGILPDSLLNCTGAAVLSFFPLAGRRRLQGLHGLEKALSFFIPLLAAGVGTLCLPLCLMENRLFGRPSIGMVLARKGRAEE